jgi:outer membrane protein, multidrug efflux system
MRKHVSVIVAATLLMAGCSLAPKFMQPKMDIPASFKETTEVSKDAQWVEAKAPAAETAGKWWTVFNDETLNALEEKAMADSPALQAAAARVEQARAIAGAAKADILPNLTVGANAARSSGVSTGGFTTAPYTSYSALGAASWEPDLFNRIRDEERALKLDAEGQQAAYRGALLALQADVAQTYYSIRALDAERRFLREAIEVRGEANRIMGKRLKEGVSSDQDFSRTESELAATRADLTALVRNRAALEHALAVLTGQMPSTFSFPETPLEGTPPKIPSGVPSQLLARRPDIAQAQLDMAAENARIGAARAAFLPSLSLNATGGFESASLGDLFKWSSRTWALGQVGALALSLPIFDNGRRSANLDRSRAAYDESVANYRQQVLEAFRDVEDALSDQALLSQQTADANLAASAAGRTQNIAQRRYDEGATDYFEVVDAQRTALTARRIAVQTEGQRYISAVSVVRALGGSWE